MMADDIRITTTMDDQQVVNALNNQINLAKELQSNYVSLGNVSEQSIKDLTKAIKGLSTEMEIASLKQNNLAKETTNQEKAAQKTGGTFRSMIGFLGKLGLATAAATAAAKLMVNIFKQTGDVVTFVQDKIAFLTGAVGEFTSRMGGLINALFNGESLADASAEAFNGLGQAMTAAGRAAEFLNQTQRVLNNALDTNTILEASRQKQAQAARQIAEDETRSYSQRIAALQQAGELEERIAERRLELARRQLQLDQGKLSQSEEAQRIAEISRLEADLAAQQFSSEQQLRSLRQERNEQIRKQREELEKLAGAADNIRQRLLEMQDAARTGLGAIQAAGIQAIEEINRLEEATRKQYEELGVAFDLAEEFAMMRAEVERRTSQEIIQYRRAEAAAKEQEAREGIEREQQAALERLDVQEQIALNAADLAERAGLSEVEAVRAAELEKLNIQRRFAEQRLALLDDQSSYQATLIRQEIDFIRQEYNSLANAPLPGLETLGDRIINALGLTQEEAQRISESFGMISGAVTDLVVSNTEAQIAQQDSLIQAIEERISETESLYQEELRRQEQGLANNADALKSNLQEQQAEREKAEQQRIALEKRAARQRLAIDAAQQASAYITTILRLGAAEAFKGVAGLFTVAAGIAILAKIVAQARSNSRQFQAQKFATGTEWVDGPGTATSDSIPAMLSRGERVLPASLNEQLGGRTVSNEELVKMYQLGRAFTASDSILAGILQAWNDTTEQREASLFRVMRDSYKEAAEAAAQKTINYWKTRPVEKIGPEGTYTEWTEGNTIKRVKKADA